MTGRDRLIEGVRVGFFAMIGGSIALALHGETSAAVFVRHGLIAWIATMLLWVVVSPLVKRR